MSLLAFLALAAILVQMIVAIPLQLPDGLLDSIIDKYVQNLDPSLKALIRNATNEFYLEAPKSIRIPNKYIIHLEPSISESVTKEIYSVFESLQGVISFKYQTGFKGFSVTLPFDLPVEALSRIPYIKAIETDCHLVANAQVQSLPSDRRFWSIDRIDGQDDNSYRFSYTGKGVNIYILDSGIDSKHPEFGNRAASVYVSPSLAASGGGDCTGHGTHVAGVIGGNIVGIAKEASLNSLRIIDCDNRSTNSQLLDALQWLLANIQLPAVINLSLGPSKSENNVYPRSPAIDFAISQLINRGATIVAAAGNDDTNPCEGSPAGTAGVIAVGAVDQNNARTFYSNYGPCVDLFASGTQILSTAPNGGYAVKQGTSQAAPHVVGVAALILQSSPQLNANSVLGALQRASKAGGVGDAQGSPNFLLQSFINDGITPNIALGDASKIGSPETDWYTIAMYVGIGVGALLVVSCLIAACVIRRRHRRNMRQLESGGPIGYSKHKKKNKQFKVSRRHDPHILPSKMNKGRRPTLEHLLESDRIPKKKAGRSKSQRRKRSKRSHGHGDTPGSSRNPSSDSRVTAGSAGLLSRSGSQDSQRTLIRNMSEESRIYIPSSGMESRRPAVRKSQSQNFPRTAAASGSRTQRKSSHPTIHLPPH